MMISNQNFQAILDLDLEQIKAKLMQAGSEGWSREKVNIVEAEYRRFLYMITAFPDELITPLEDVDTFWHYHILDTMKYAADCEAAFGRFVHHYPYFGMRGEEDYAVYEQAGKRMHELYEKAFGASYGEAAVAMARASIALGTAPDSKPAFGVEGSAKPAFCVKASAKPAFCVKASAKPAFCVEASAKPAFCVEASAKPAFCVEASAKPAFCVEASAKPAFCVKASAKPAFCVEVRAKPASCVEASAKPAFCVKAPASALATRRANAAGSASAQICA
jgi:hypothetical protein